MQEINKWELEGTLRKCENLKLRCEQNLREETLWRILKRKKNLEIWDLSEKVRVNWIFIIGKK